MAKTKAGFTRRADGKLEFRFMFDGKRVSVYGNTYDECQQRALERREALQKKLNLRNANVSLLDYYHEWQGGRTGTVKESTQYANDVKFARVAKLIGTRKVADIEPREIKAIQKELAANLSTTTVNDTIALLHCIFEAAITDRIRIDNPTRAIKNLKRIERPAAETIHRALTEDEQRIFLNYAQGTWYVELYKFMLCTGVRISEAAALTWNDIDTESGVIHVNKTLVRVSNTEYRIDSPKTRTSKRDIPLTDDIYKILMEQKQKSSLFSIDGRIFTAQNGGYVLKSVVNPCIDFILRKIEKETGTKIEHFSTHCFRDTFATRAYTQGMDAKTLSTILGHSDVGLTMNLYCHSMESTRKEAMQRLKIVI